jgi:hypothetical protein
MQRTALLFFSMNEILLELNNPFDYSLILKAVIHAQRIVIAIAGSCCGSQCITIGKYS